MPTFQLWVPHNKVLYIHGKELDPVNKLIQHVLHIKQILILMLCKTYGLISIRLD
jgi:hypothetical protein